MDYLLSLSILPLLAYGWVLEYRLHPSIPLILQFFIGGAMTIIFNACGTLLVDLHPSRPIDGSGGSEPAPLCNCRGRTRGVAATYQHRWSRVVLHCNCAGNWRNCRRVRRCWQSMGRGVEKTKR